MNKTIHTLSCILLAFSCHWVNAQNLEINGKCGTEIPSQQWENEFQKKISELIENKTANKTQQGYTIPVIIHVIHGGQAVGTYPNLAQGQLNSQIQVLNNDYAGTGFNSGNYPATAFAAWASTVQSVLPASLDGNGRVAIANCNVQFCLATKDSLGNILPEPGIDRINYVSKGWPNPASASLDYNAFKNLMDNTIKPQTIWNVSRYLNIWITDGNLNSTGGLLGYATFPPLTGLSGINFANGTSISDGFWCYAQAFGSANIFPSGTYMQGYTRGRTSTHEIGHWLGLRHIWGDGTCATDYCNDTPRANDQNFGSPSYPHNVNLCSGSGNGEMFMNFMDYTNDNAKYMFTTDQANRIQAAMANSPYRKFLGTHNLCSVASVAATAFFSSPINACTGVGLNLSNTSTGWPPPTFTWSSNGGTFSPNPQVTSPSVHFSSPGVYTVSLASSNGTTSVYTKTITVTSPTLYFSSTSQTICQGGVAIFYVSGVDTYTWEPGTIVDAAVGLNPLSSQVYTCTGTEINGCKTSSLVEVFVSPCVGIDSYKLDEINLIVYPNPAMERLNVQLNTAEPSGLTMEVTDAVGRTVRREAITNVSAGEIHVVDIADLDNGIYFIKVVSVRGSARTVKFVKGN